MNRGEIQSVLRSAGVDLWTLIDSAISIASSDHHSELRSRRDGIVERLYSPISNPDPITCDNNINSNAKLINNVIREEEKGSSSPIEKVFGSSPLTPQSNCKVDMEDEDDVDIDDNDLIDQEGKILAVKDCLEDPDQCDDVVVGLLQSLEDMDITFKALTDTDIGRHVNVLRKHPSTEVRRLVKELVRKWKEIVDDWVKNNPDTASPANNNDAYSPQQILSKHTRNGNHVPEFAYSPDPNNGKMSCNRNSIESNSKSAPIRETPLKSILSTPTSAALSKLKGQESLIDDQRLANARKRLAENYQEAQNAKTQRKIQVMDIHEIPKPKNSFISRNKGGGHHNPHQSKRW